MSTEVPALFLLTNDDGIDAPGLAALAQAAAMLGSWEVIAPAEVWSCKGHAITTDRTIGWEVVGPGRVAVGGTPADCVRLGLHHLVPGASWILSGINAGGNLGADIHHSGTVAAAREAVLHGFPAIAISHYIRRELPLDWDRASRLAGRIIKGLIGLPWEPGTLWNINLPHLPPDAPEPEIVRCPVDPSPLPLRFEVEGSRARYNGNYHGRSRLTGHDVEVCFSGKVSVSLVRVLDPVGRTAVLPGA
jgi:5'-nucleotidase